jgi:hypothetical protein
MVNVAESTALSEQQGRLGEASRFPARGREWAPTGLVAEPGQRCQRTI